MPKKKEKVVKKVEKKAELPTALDEAREKLADMETLYALLTKWNIQRLGTVVELLNQLRTKVAELEKTED